MSRRLFGYVTLMFLLLSVMLFSEFPLGQSADASAPTVQWSKTYLGTSGTYVIQTSDEGYVIVTSPLISSPDTLLELIKTDSAGNQVWLKTYPGFPGDVLIAQTNDDGIALAGTTSDSKFFIAKLDASGVVVWNATFGDSYSDRVTNLVKTDDGGFAVLGSSVPSYLNYPDTSYRALLAKFDSAGKLMWNQTYRGSQDINPCGLSQTSDGGYLLAVTTQYFGFSVWLVKTDASGNTQWYRPFQSSQIYGRDVLTTSDGGSLLLTQINSYQAGSGTYVSSSLAIKTNSNGDQQWNQTYANSYTNAVQTPDGAYVLGVATSGNVVLSEIDGLGNILWNGSYTVSVTSNTKFLTVTADGGVALTGVSSDRAMLTKLAPVASAPSVQLPAATPHSTANATFLQEVFVPGEGGTSIVQTTDGGYIAVGQVSSIEDQASSVLIKTDSALNIQWSRPIRFDADTTMVRVVQTQDGGYAAVGETGTDTGWGIRFALAKYSSTGQLEWNQTYPLSAPSDMYNYVEGFVQTNDGGFLFAATTSYSITGPPYIVRTNSSGSLIWAKSVTTTSGDPFFGVAVASLVQATDGGFTIIGSDRPYSAMPSSYFELIHLDVNGNTVWTKSYGNQNGDFHSSVSDGIVTSDGGYLLLGVCTTSSGGYDSVLLVKTDSQGNMTWFQTFDGSQLNSAGSVSQATDGGYILSSTTYRFVCLVKLSSVGDIQDIVTLDTIFPESYGNSLPAVTVGSDGFLVFTGQYAGFNNTVYDDIWLAKLSVPFLPSIPEYPPILLLIALCAGSIAIVLATQKRKHPAV